MRISDYRSLRASRLDGERSLVMSSILVLVGSSWTGSFFPVILKYAFARTARTSAIRSSGWDWAPRSSWRRLPKTSSSLSSIFISSSSIDSSKSYKRICNCPFHPAKALNSLQNHPRIAPHRCWSIRCVLLLLTNIDVDQKTALMNARGSVHGYEPVMRPWSFQMVPTNHPS